MTAVLFLALVAVPIIEIALFIEIGGLIGILPTLATVIVTAALGAILLRAQGGGLLRRAHESMARGAVPVAEVVHGVFLLAAGLLLLTPGFFTDAIGFALMIPPVRLAVGRFVLRRIRARMVVHGERRSPGSPPEPPSDGGGGPSKWRPPDGPS